MHPLTFPLQGDRLRLRKIKWLLLRVTTLGGNATDTTEGLQGHLFLLSSTLPLVPNTHTQAPENTV